MSRGVTEIRKWTATVTLIATTALLVSVAPAAAAERLTNAEARAAVEATQSQPESRAEFAQHVVFNQDVADGYVKLADPTRTGPRRIRFWADAWVTSVAGDFTAPAYHYAGIRYVTIVKRRSGRILARSTVVLSDGDAFTVGYPLPLG